MKQQNLINAVSIIAAPFTGGASLLGLFAPYVLGGSDDNSSQIMKQWEMQNDQWKTMFEATQKEIRALTQVEKSNLTLVKLLVKLLLNFRISKFNQKFDKCSLTIVIPLLNVSKTLKLY